MKSKFFLVIFVLSLVNLKLSAQTKPQSGFTKHEKLNLTASLGLTTYYGDLCDKFECMKFRPNFGIGAWYRFTNHISNKTEINYYRLYAKDVWTDRNLDFRSGNVEFYTSILLDMFPYTKHFRKRKFISPYVFAGIGFTYFNPKGQDQDGSWVALRPLQTEAIKYSPMTMILPFGVGFKIKYQKNYDFVIEAGYRKSFSDHLDDVSSKTYVNKSNFDSEVAQRMSMKSTTTGDNSYSNTYLYQQRGNPDKKDGYFIFNVKFRYIVGATSTQFKGKHPLLKPSHK